MSIQNCKTCKYWGIPHNNVSTIVKDAPCSKIEDVLWIILYGDTHGVGIENINTPENFGCTEHTPL